MNPLDDSLAALEVLEKALGGSAQRRTINGLHGNPVTYTSEAPLNDLIEQRALHVKDMLRHLNADGIPQGEGYVERRFHEVLGYCLRAARSTQPRSTVESRREWGRVVHEYREWLARTAAPYAVTVSTTEVWSGPDLLDVGDPAPATDPTPVPKTESPLKKKRENVGYGWPAKIAFAGVLATVAFLVYPRLVPHSDSLPKDRITVTLAVCALAFTIANVVRKP